MNMHANFASLSSFESQLSSPNAGITGRQSHFNLYLSACGREFVSPVSTYDNSRVPPFPYECLLLSLDTKSVFIIIPTESIIIRSFAPPHPPWSVACWMARCTKETGSSCFLRGNFLALCSVLHIWIPYLLVTTYEEGKTLDGCDGCGG